MIKQLFLYACILIPFVNYAQIAPEVATLPADWTRLTQMEDVPAVYNTCNGGNLKLRLYKEGKQWQLLCHGQQEDYLFNIKKATTTRSGIVFDCNPKDSKDQQQFIFTWTDKPKGLSRWEAIGWDWNDSFVSLFHEVDYLHIEQPCEECWGEEECDGMEEYYEPIDAIRAVFSNYVHYGESTDSNKNKALMSKALDKLKGRKLSQNDLRLLVSVWMYYDPTDFSDATSKSLSLLKANKTASIKAVKFMIDNKRDWESEDSAPYADLPLLLLTIEGD